MARGAGRRKSCLNVIRVIGAVVVLEVTRGATGRRIGEIAPDVAQSAGHADVRPSQGERSFVVVESRGRPCGSRMACGAGRRKSCLDVLGVGGAIEILHMARGAIRRSAIKFSAYVAQRAIQTSVRPCEGEPGDL